MVASGSDSSEGTAGPGQSGFWKSSGIGGYPGVFRNPSRSGAIAASEELLCEASLKPARARGTAFQPAALTKFQFLLQNFYLNH